jgi:hypothetical protein
MKTLTLHQPWATLVALGAKQIETRSWPTRHRGLLAIHAAKNTPPDALAHADQEPFQSTLAQARFLGSRALPAGAIVAIANLAAVHDIILDNMILLVDNAHIPIIGFPKQPELSFGDYTPGRHAWLLPQVIAHPHPNPPRGRQRLWEWSSPTCPICDEWLGLPNSGLCQHCHDTNFNPSILPIRVLKQDT